MTQPWAWEGFFPGGRALADFSLNFSRGGGKLVKFDFSHSKLRKQPFFGKNFKI